MVKILKIGLCLFIALSIGIPLALILFMAFAFAFFSLINLDFLFFILGTLLTTIGILILFGGMWLIMKFLDDCL